MRQERRLRFAIRAFFILLQINLKISFHENPYERILDFVVLNSFWLFFERAI